MQQDSDDQVHREECYSFKYAWPIQSFIEDFLLGGRQHIVSMM